MSLESGKGIRIETRTLLFLFLFLSSVVTGHWIHFDITPVKTTLLIFAALVLTVLPESFWPEDYVFSWPESKLTLGQIVIGLFAYLPILLYLVLSWRSEFPFGGDNSFHVFTATTYYRFLTRILPSIVVDLGLIVSLLGGIFLLLWLPTQSYTLKISKALYLPAYLALWGASFFISFAEEQMRSYPQMFYILSIFFQGIAHLFKWDQPYNAYRLLNALAPFFWLFILRPIFIKRWPDKRALFIAVFFYWRWPLLYFGVGNYLESWPLVFLLLAVEKLFDSHTESHWISFLLIGFSTLFKENGLFFFPFVLALILVQNRKKFISQAVTGFLCSVPFLLYYFHRTHADTGRSFVLDNWENLSDSYRMEEFYSRIQFFLGSTPVQLMIPILLLLCIVALLQKNYSRKIFLGILGSAFLFFILFFYLDRTSGSEIYIGYPRFHFYWLLFYGWILIACFEAINKKWVENGILVLFLLLNGLGSYQFLSISHGDDFRRNTLENYDSATYYPVRRLLNKLGDINYATLVLITERYYPFDLARVYGIEGRVEMLNAPLTPPREPCICSRNEDLWMFVHEFPANLFLNDSKSEVKRIALSALKDRAGQLGACYEKLKSSCLVTVEELASNGEVWGVAGWGKK